MEQSWCNKHPLLWKNRKRPKAVTSGFSPEEEALAALSPCFFSCGDSMPFQKGACTGKGTLAQNKTASASSSRENPEVMSWWHVMSWCHCPKHQGYWVFLCLGQLFAVMDYLSHWSCPKEEEQTIYYYRQLPEKQSLKEIFSDFQLLCFKLLWYLWTFCSTPIAHQLKIAALERGPTSLLI